MAKGDKGFSFSFLLAAAALLILPPNQYVAAKTYNDVEKFIDEFAANNIMFYNPLDCVGGKSGGNTVLPGNNTKEKMWNYFIRPRTQLIVLAMLAVDANCDDETAKNAAVEDFKKIISERGMNTDGVVFSFDESYCKAYEDHGGGGHGDHNH